MPKGHRGVGNYIGASGSYATGGSFSARSVQTLASGSSWKPNILQTGLQLHLDASTYSGSGTTWTDQSVNGRNFTFTSGPSFTSGSIPYFEMGGYGANGPASNSFGINNSSGYTIFVAFYNNGLANSGAFKFYSSNGSGSQSRGIFSHLPWSSGDIYLDQGGCCNADTRTSVALTNSTGAWNVVAFRSNAVNERSIWQNGTNKVTNSTAPAALNLSGTAVALNNSDEYGTSWNAKLSQFAVYNRALSDAEIVSVTNFLKAKVGL